MTVDAAASLASVYKVLRTWAETNGASDEMLASIEKASANADAFSEGTLAAQILAGIQKVIADAAQHEKSAYQRQLDAAVRHAEKNVTAAEDELPGLQEAVDKAAEAERIAHDDATDALGYLHKCEDALAHARDRQVSAEAEAEAIEKLREAEAISLRRRVAYDAAMEVTRGARKALRDGQGKVTQMKDALEDARAEAANPGPAPKSMWTLGLLGPWMLLWGPSLNETERAAVQEIVLAMAQLCGADRIIANRERTRIEAEIRDSRSRAIQSLSKHAPRIDAPSEGNVWPTGAMPSGAVATAEGGVRRG